MEKPAEPAIPPAMLRKEPAIALIKEPVKNRLFDIAEAIGYTIAMFTIVTRIVRRKQDTEHMIEVSKVSGPAADEAAWRVKEMWLTLAEAIELRKQLDDRIRQLQSNPTEMQDERDRRS